MAPLKNPRNPSPRQVLLGLFILFQIAFLIASNLLDFIVWAPPKFIRLAARESDERKNRRKLLDRLVPGFADERGHLWQWTDHLDTNMRRWKQLSGQDQAWALFAPGVHTETGWPAVLLLWDDPSTEDPAIPGTMFAFDKRDGFNLWADWNRQPAGELSLPMAGHIGLLASTCPYDFLMVDAANETRKAAAVQSRAELLLSVNEPADIYDFVRFGKARFRRFEGQLYFDSQADRESADELATRLTETVRKSTRRYHALTHEYLRLRYHDWKRAHPNEPPPTQVILLNRLYHIRGPKGERHDPSHNHPGWDGPFVIPVARWQPDAQHHPDYCALEPFDFTNRRFVLTSK